MVAPNRVDSNDASMAMCEEAAIGVLPGTPVWYQQEVNQYADFGGDPTLTTRSILGTRKKQDGSIVGIAPKSGWNSDFTLTNQYRNLQGFFFADAVERASTAPLNSAAVVLTSTASADSSYNAAAGLGLFVANDLVEVVGCPDAANNGLKNIVTSVAAKIVVSQAVITSAAGLGVASITRVGFQFAAGDLTASYVGGVFSINTTTKDLRQLFTQVGEWCFIGGDAAVTQYATAGLAGYGRVQSIAQNKVVFDKVTFTPATDAGAAKTIQVFVGAILSDALGTVKRRTYRQERQLGNDGVGIQTEQIIGAVSNELTLNIPKKDKLNTDLGYIALDVQQYSGAIGLAAGTRIAAFGEPPFNTSTDIFRMRLSIFDGVTLLPTGFGYATTANLKINNNASIDECVGAVGGFEVSLGDFEISGQMELYFSTIASIQAVRNKLQTSFDIIAAAKNTGWIFDMPFVELSGGIAKIEKGKPIMLPVNTAAVQSAAGHTVLANFFPYLPTLAMPKNISPSVQI